MNDKSKLKIKNIFSKSESLAFNTMHKFVALKTLKSIEKEKGKLSKDLITKCDSYAKDYLGHSKFAPWLYVYSAIQGEFKTGWMPDNFYAEVVVKKTDGDFSKISEMKPLSNQILKTNRLPDLLYIHNGLFIKPDDYKVISDPQVAINLIFQSHNQVIFKSNSSSQGRGITFYSRDNLELNILKNTSGVFQSIIEQHDFFNNIFPYPGATIRITTVLDSEGKASVRAAYLRLGRNNNSSISTHVQAFNLVKTSINLKTGALYPLAYMPDWSTTSMHPDTGVHFEGLTIPGFRSACNYVESLHENYPFVQCIGWDVIINKEENIEIMEWNSGHNDIKFSEATQGPCFTDLVDRAISSQNLSIL